MTLRRNERLTEMSTLGDATPSAAAEALLRRHNITKVPVPLERIARAEGAQVRYVPLDHELSGMVYVKQNTPFIGVNALHHPNRQRFTIAHEIGHLILHRDRISNAVHVDKEFRITLGLRRDTQSALGTDQMEIQANQFAASLLMPLFFVEHIMGAREFDIDNDGPVEKFARQLRVSTQALQYRIRNLP